MRAFLLLLLVPFLVAGVAAPAPQAHDPVAPEAFDTVVRPYLATYCYGCHNASKQKGSLNLKAHADVRSVFEETNLWDKVLQKVRTGEMPPDEEGEPRPDPARSAALISWLEKAIEHADRIAAPEPGRVTVRRLNRAEYNNTIRDLLGVASRPADEFPHDDSGYGFDNIGDVLSISPLLMERYMIAAERVARTALFGPEIRKPTLIRKDAGARHIEPLTTVPASYDETGLTLPNAMHTTHDFPATGDYIIRVFAGGSRAAGSEPVRIALWVDGRRAAMQPLDPEGASFFSYKQDFSGKLVEFRQRIPAGSHWIAGALERLYEGLPPSYGGPNPSKLPIPPKPEFKPRPGIPPERLEEIRKRFEEMVNEVVPINDVRVSFMEIAGPYNQETGPSRASLEKIYVCGHLDGRHSPDCPRRIVEHLLNRAFRRPVTPAEVERYLGFVTSAQRHGDPFEEGLAVALQAMLVAPDFLFRIEHGEDVPGAPGLQRLTQHELASRLSYFLWASMPDDELRRAADAGMLRNPEVLEAQVRRMLKDPKSRSLVQEFGGQWLQFRALESASPDRERFPAFEDYLRLSMQRETELFFEAIVREDRSVLEFIDADYTFLNERLARHYGIDGIRGPEFRRTALADSRRGGVITHASVLTVSSYATRTSPVLRGKWILENLLNSPPPPPPPGVENLDEQTVSSAASLREQLETHRSDPTCASCHRRMDPLGFGLENYDAIGAWRGTDGDTAIDASGVLPDGRSFAGPAELKAILSGEREAFARALTSKLLTYALGRGLEPYDQRTVRNIARRLPGYDYRFSGLVLEIVNSTPFQMRRGSNP
ncbi:MAG TPA: DUF1592 domain-containing protein [Vicinamibacterales bacterium]|nr:DUF1592 domain-containing protein [Vicinamibacterales bacterium]